VLQEDGSNTAGEAFLPPYQYTDSIHTKSNQHNAVSSENQQTQRLSSVRDGYSPGLHSEVAMNTDSLIFKTLSHRNVESGVLRRNFNTGPAETLTEPGLFRDGGRSYRRIRETPQDREQLDPRTTPFQNSYMELPDSWQFTESDDRDLNFLQWEKSYSLNTFRNQASTDYKQVFKILWPELPRDIDDNISISSVGRFDDAVISKIRWFVVVREGRSCCSCL